MQDTPGVAILKKEPAFEADFTVPSSVRYKKKVVRYPFNPEAYWGPKARAQGKRNQQPEEEQPAQKKAKTEEG